MTGSLWAAWLSPSFQGWETLDAFGLTSQRNKCLNQLLAEARFSAWLAGSLSTGRLRNRQTAGELTSLGCARLFAYPNAAEQAVLLVGTDQLTSAAREMLHLLARAGPVFGGEQQPERPESIQLPELEASFDLQETLQWVLEHLLTQTPCDAAYIALRYGDVFRVRARWNMPEAIAEIDIGINSLAELKQMVSSRQGMVVRVSQSAQADFLTGKLNPALQSWMAAPIVFGQRIIGFAAFFSYQRSAFTKAILRSASANINRFAPLIENAIMFSEAARHLQQLALVNELAASIATVSDLGQVEQRLMQRLRRVFGLVNISLLLLSADGEMLYEAIDPTSGENALVLPAANSLSGYVVELGKPVRVGDIRLAPRYQEVYAGVKSALVVPLKYRGKIIGVLNLTSRDLNAFSQQDEQLMIMISSHLAGMVENLRLNEQTRQRALNLSLIHQVVNRVIGLNHTGQIAAVAAGLMVEQFNYDYTFIYRVQEAGKQIKLLGWAGEGASGLTSDKSYPVLPGLVYQVIRDGIGRICSDIESAGCLPPIHGERAMSEMAVLLTDGEQVMGVIDVQRVNRFAFDEADLLALEALASVLSSIMKNAEHYQQLQTNVRQLRAARETALDVAGDLDLEMLLNRLVRRARELLEAPAAELALVDAQSQTVRVVVSETPWQLEVGRTLAYMEGLEGKVAVEGEPVLLEGAQGRQGQAKGKLDLLDRSVAAVPLKLKGEVIGVLSVSDDHPQRQFTLQDIELLELLAPQVAVFIHNARLYQELQARMQVQKLAESQLVRSARLAAVGEMAAGVAHELNNPLTTVTGFIELVLDDLPADSPARPDLELVLREARRARGVVRQLLDFSRPTESVRVRSDVNDLVNDVLSLVQHLIRTSAVDLRTNLAEGLPWINIDPNQLKQVLLNLIHNALNAMPHGGSLTLATGLKRQDDQDWLVISVADSGSGIAPEHLERIFEPFFTTQAAGSGTGLGLSVSYGIVSEHGGFIDVESTLEEGSCFKVRLPV